jgi:hypothetical protein
MKQENSELVLEKELATAMNNISTDSSDFWLELRKDMRVVLILGGSGTGKSALSMKKLQSFRGYKPIYVYKHPKPEIMSAMGYINLYSESEMYSLHDCVLWISEPQLWWARGDKKSNEMFELLCTLARQKDITLIFDTCDSRWVTRGLESHITHWVIKKIDVELLKNGSSAKKIIKNLMPLVTKELELKNTEYLFYTSVDKKYNGLHTFSYPLYYDERLSKAYKYA